MAKISKADSLVLESRTVNLREIRRFQESSEDTKREHITSQDIDKIDLARRIRGERRLMVAPCMISDIITLMYNYIPYIL